MPSPTSQGAAVRVREFWARSLGGPPIARRALLWEELASSLGAGTALGEAIRYARARHAGAVGALLDRLGAAVDAGRPISDEMRRPPYAFLGIEADLVATGERTGRLDAAFRETAAVLDRRRRTRDRIVGACAYPLVLMHCLVVIPSAGFIIPAHGVTAWIVFAACGVAAIWALLAAAVSAVVALAPRPGFARLVRRIPVVGRASESAAVGRFARIFAALHGAGVPHAEALRSSADASADPLVAADARRAADALDAGALMSSALASFSSIPAEEMSLLLTAERSGELEEAARRVADLEDQRLEAALSRVIALLPTILVLLVGIVVAILALRVFGSYYSALNGLVR